jgi:hypothetical protein
MSVPEDTFTPPVEGQEVAPAVAAEEVVEAPEVEEDESAEEENDESQEGLQEKKPRVRNAAARIDQLTREKSELKRELDRIRLAAAPAPQSPAQGAPTEPTPDQFDDYGDYVKALARHEVAQERAKAAAETHASIRQADWSTKVEAAQSSIADWNDVVGSSEVTLRDDIVDAMKEADRGAELLYHMASHPEVCARLNGLSPAKAAIELGRLEATLDAPVIRRASSAPAPITPVRGGPTTKIDLNKAGMDDYVAERRRQMAGGQ